jgi:hypothetical protein
MCRAIIFVVTHLLSMTAQAVILPTGSQVGLSFNLIWGTGYPEFLIILLSPATKIPRFWGTGYPEFLIVLLSPATKIPRFWGTGCPEFLIVLLSPATKVPRLCLY